ncbi:MAG: four helix bundle protein [Saprospiraceae bacterium]|nr:four helix bundle protein [Saprospiraceae bacterium]
MKIHERNIVLEKSIQFSIKLIRYCEELELRKKFVISNQLLQSGASIGANIHEAQDAESKLDFIHKLKIAAKELNETIYWLTICNEVETFPKELTLRSDLYEISRLLNKIISTSKLSAK